jgi:hypothetical protein
MIKGADRECLPMPADIIKSRAEIIFGATDSCDV